MLTKCVKIRNRSFGNALSWVLALCSFPAINGFSAPAVAPPNAESPGRAIWSQMQAWLESQKTKPSASAASKSKKKAPSAPVSAAAAPWENGKPILIEGFLIPNEMEGGDLETFLLSRTPSGCVHVPLPPPSSIIYVRMGSGAKRLHDVTTTLPVQVKGKLGKGGRIDSEFEMEAESVEILRQP